MGNLGSFQPFQNPDLYQVGQFMEGIRQPDGSLNIDHTVSDRFTIGDGDNPGDRTLAFNVNGRDADNPALRWNETLTRVEFSYDGTNWYPVEYVEPGDGLDRTGTSSVTFSVDVTDFIDTAAGLAESQNVIQVNLKDGGGLRFSLGAIECYFGTPTSGNVLSANGSGWQSATPDAAGLVAKTSDQSISGTKTFSNEAVFSSGAWAQAPARFDSYLEIGEISTPPDPPADKARLFTRDNGSGKTELCVKFPGGNVQVIAVEP